MFSHKCLYINVHNSIIHDSKNWKQYKCPSNSEWILSIEEFVCAGEYDSIIKEQLLICETWMMSPPQIMLN